MADAADGNNEETKTGDVEMGTVPTTEEGASTKSPEQKSATPGEKHTQNGSQDMGEADQLELDMNGRKFHMGWGMIKWYFGECSVPPSGSHATFTAYTIVLLGCWVAYICAFTLGIEVDEEGNYTDESVTTFHYCMLACCLTGILMSFVAVPRIKEIVDVRESLIKLNKQKRKLREKHELFRKNVERMSKAKKKLEEVQKEVTDSNTKLKDNYGHLKSHGTTINENNKQSLRRLKEMKAHFEECKRNCQKLLMRKERQTMNGIFLRVSKEDDEEGMSMEEFQKFVSKLPDHLKARFEPMDKTFCSYAGSDMNMDYGEFQTMIRNVAVKEAEQLDPTVMDVVIEVV